MLLGSRVGLSPGQGWSMGEGDRGQGQAAVLQPPQSLGPQGSERDALPQASQKGSYCPEGLAVRSWPNSYTFTWYLEASG